MATAGAALLRRFHGGVSTLAGEHQLASIAGNHTQPLPIPVPANRFLRLHSLTIHATHSASRSSSLFHNQRYPYAPSNYSTASSGGGGSCSQNIIKDQEPQRLSKTLAAAAVASRRSSEKLIFEGRVTVNGVICKSPQTPVDVSKDSIYVNGNQISKKIFPKLYFAVNKPKGYICSGGEEPKSVVSLFDEYLERWKKYNPGFPKPRLFTVGRLDVATTGLIIVTNDGNFAQRLSHPSYNLTKEYIATIEGHIHKRHLITIREGTTVEGVHCIPDSVELVAAQPDVPRTRLRIVVHEGKNHEVREIVKNAGLQVYSLKRVRIGDFQLPQDLRHGKHMVLNPSDLELLRGKATEFSSTIHTEMDNSHKETPRIIAQA